MNQQFSPFSKKSEVFIKVGVIVFLIVIVGVTFLFHFLSKDRQENSSKLPLLVTDSNSNTNQEEDKEKNDDTNTTQVVEEVPKVDWMVDIKGEVVTNGTYRVTEEMRVIDVITLAGGLTENADTTLLNLSQKVKDQMVIIIYSKEEVQHMEQVMKRREELLAHCKNGEIINDACISNEEEEEKQDNAIENTMVNINTATKEELSTLPGIGEKKAEAIIQYREEKGPFQKPEDIMQVSGIGESVYDTISDKITIGS